ncbi:MAG: response regulator [Defluviitaleaceae bacterium]|nr:response regulator [Defluviitaleaceae bacterium]
MDNKKYRILVADDENSNIMKLSHILSPQYIVYAAKNGEGAIKAAEKHLPDVILLDIIMPDMDGYEVLGVLKSSEKTKNIPVIFISGLSDTGDEEKGLNLGAADYIAKPFSDALVKIRVRNQIKLLEQFSTNEYDIMKYKLSNDALNIGLWDMDVVNADPVSPSHKFTWSQEIRHMLGFKDESDFPNVLQSWSSRIHPEDKARILAAFAAHMNDYTGQTPYNVEQRIMNKDGEYRHFHTLGTSCRDRDGAPIRVAGAAIDITEKKRMERENLELAEAEILNKAKSAFLANMSHEIRTPMNAIIGITEILLQSGNLPEEAIDGLGRIYNSGNLLLAIINDILDLSKIEAGKLDIVPAPYNFADMLGESLQLNIMRREEKPIEFDVELDENIPLNLIGDQVRIKQILNNLLSNAFKYTEAGRVTLMGSFENDSLIITVRDTGQGMTAEQMQKIFDEYSRFNQESNRTIEGIGLGMSITYNLLKLMGGDIKVESQKGRGSVFTVRLPQGIADNAVLGELSHSLRLLSPSSIGSARSPIVHEPMPNGRVLIVDDVEYNLYVATGLMKPYRLQIDTASSGSGAIDLVKSGRVYDIIFMDHMMPVMDGIQAVKHIRELGYTAPIVALTANAIVGQEEMFLQNGFDEFISKPIDVRRLNAVLTKLVQNNAPASKASPAASLLHEYKIDGLDIAKGLDKFGGEPSAYLRVLQKYADSSRLLLGTLEHASEENLHDYEICVHGIKGASFDIFADELGEIAKGLEAAAKERRLDYITEHNSHLLDMARKLTADIADLARAVEAANPKPKKDKPDPQTLSKLAAACKAYSMDGVDEAMAEIESYQYSCDDGLSVWLRGKVDIMRFSEIVDKLCAKGTPRSEAEEA